MKARAKASGQWRPDLVWSDVAEGGRIRVIEGRLVATTSDSASTAGPDRVDNPNPFWVVVVIGGLYLLWLQGFSPDFYAWWTAKMHGLPPQSVWRWIFIACIPIHVFEAGYCYKLANKLGLRKSAPGWATSAFFLGWPATRLLKARARQA